MDAAHSNPPRNRTWIKILGTLVIAVLATIGYLSLSSQKAAPEVTFNAITGQQVSMQSLRGKVVMVNFWATSCTTCVKEMPQMVQTYQKYKDKGLDFVAVAMSYDPPNYVLNYAQTRNLPFHVALDTKGDVAKSFDDVKLTPTTYVIDKKGNIIKRYVGEPDFAALHQLLEKALAA
ncbi:TlpA disulfide reductase family protein [Noviherbaspirillum sp. CPCC 100848]|uniref:TlpA disulfide reductase family protein n=1 Tax=Noviherbaspirillum album TaxID=3080276 RepID=A0ABU6J5Q7_9BURK|nr:TlpA disulfide reductase family protein [Noviherbaspirillum sp. CPCC 100848]MEC4718746.1 TlpA disulfide reductase family protein [Noviherbaspirillum sp. CPCC 100848]